MSQPPVSIIIPAWNGRDTLDACLGAVAAIDYPTLEVVVVDNASTDDSAGVARERGLDAMVIRSPRNLGFAGGCNLGLERASGEILVLLNQDAVVEREWLSPLVEALAATGAGVVGSKCLYPDGATVQSAGGSIVWPLGLAFSRGQHKPDGPAWSHEIETDFVSGCGMAFRRDLIEEIGPLDTTFWPGYYEDVDFCLRARAAGRTVHMVPEARLRHLESGAFRRWRSIWRFHHRSRVHCVLKNLPFSEIMEGFLPTERQVLPALAATVRGADLARAYAESTRRTLPRLIRSGHLRPEEGPPITESLLQLAELAIREPVPAAAGEPAALLATRRHLVAALVHARGDFDRNAHVEPAEGSDRSHDWLQLALDSRESELASVKEVLSARAQELGATARHLRSLEDDARALRSTIAAGEEQIESLGDVIAERDRQVGSLEENLAARTAESAAATEQIESLSSVLAARDEQIGAAEVELERHRAKLDSTLARLRELETGVALLERGLLGRFQVWRARRSLARRN